MRKRGKSHGQQEKTIQFLRYFVPCLRPGRQHPENFEGQTESPFSRQGASQVRLWRIFLGAAHVYIGTRRNCAGTLLNWTYFKHEKKHLYMICKYFAHQVCWAEFPSSLPMFTARIVHGLYQNLFLQMMHRWYVQNLTIDQSQKVINNNLSKSWSN